MRRQHRLLTVIAAVFLVSIFNHSTAREAAAACQDDGRLPTLEVNVVPWQIRYDYTHSQAELSALVQRQNWLSAGHSARGLYNAELMHRHLIEFDESIGGWTAPNCLSVSRVALELTYFEPTIYLAKELQWARCVAIEVRNHEQKHARVDRDMMEWFSQLMRGELTKWLALRGVREVSDIEAAKARDVQDLQRAIARTVQLFVDERNRRQQAIDTPQEYARIEAACPNN